MPTITQHARPDLHQAVLDWFTSHGLEVHEAHYQFDHGCFAWRHHANKRAVTLWVSETTAEEYPAATIVAILRDIEPKALMRKFRHAHIHVASNASEFGVYVRDAFTPRAGDGLA
jgi:hypothetical protein